MFVDDESIFHLKPLGNPCRWRIPLRTLWYSFAWKYSGSAVSLNCINLVVICQEHWLCRNCIVFIDYHSKFTLEIWSVWASGTSYDWDEKRLWRVYVQFTLGMSTGERGSGVVHTSPSSHHLEVCPVYNRTVQYYFNDFQRFFFSYKHILFMNYLPRGRSHQNYGKKSSRTII
jgi:hypothetical protein